LSKSSLVLFAIAVLAASFLVYPQAVPVGRAQASLQYANWPSSAYNGFNTNNDPQSVINVNNVQNLQVKWIYQVPENPYDIPGAAPSLGIETQPLIISGILYFATPYNRVIALNAGSGDVIWSYQVNMSEFVNDTWWSYAYNISSIAYYDGVVYFTASDTTVYGLNATTGAVELTIPDTGANIPGNTGTYFGEKAPLLYGDTLVVRASTTDYGGRGYVRAYNVKTKQLLWQWFSVPPAGGQADWDANASLGNIAAYSGDWGNSTLIGGGAAWGLMTLDNRTGLLYFSTGHPSDVYDASLRPGPNLYTDCVIALNVTDGRLVWYYQINPHDLTEHEGGWSITLANLTINGQAQEVVIQAAKNNYVYVLSAAKGALVVPPIYLGSPEENVPNDNAGSGANLTENQAGMVGRPICPGTDGGVEMAPALDGDNLFVASQNACGQMTKGPLSYKGQIINGYIYQGDPATSQNSTLYSIDLADGKINWEFLMPDRYQGSSAVVSGGVVYAVDRDGVLYALNEQTGQLLRSIQLGGLGASGVSIGRDFQGDMMVFVPAGGGDLPTSTPGLVLGLQLVTQSTSSTNPLYSEIPVIALGVIVVFLGVYILSTRSKRRMTATASPEGSEKSSDQSLPK